MLHLDTSTVIEILRFRKNALLKFEMTSTAEMRVSSIVVAELWAGAQLAPEGSRSRARLETLLSLIEIVPFNQDAAKIAGQIKFDLTKRGLQIGMVDPLIAAAAIADGASLATCDISHFRRIKGLELADWSKA